MPPAGFVYMLVSRNSSGRLATYIGATVHPDRRLRQHNGQTVGGARSTRGREWHRAVLVGGAMTFPQALSLEWHWKHSMRRQRRPASRRDGESAEHRHIFNIMGQSPWPHTLARHRVGLERALFHVSRTRHVPLDGLYMETDFSRVF